MPTTKNGFSSQYVEGLSERLAAAEVGDVLEVAAFQLISAAHLGGRDLREEAGLNTESHNEVEDLIRNIARITGRKAILELARDCQVIA